MMTIKSSVPCPICGRRMTQSSIGCYYKNKLGLVSLECEECQLEVKEFGFKHGFEDGEPGSYEKLMNILKERMKK